MKKTKGSVESSSTSTSSTSTSIEGVPAGKSSSSHKRKRSKAKPGHQKELSERYLRHKLRSLRVVNPELNRQKRAYTRNVLKKDEEPFVLSPEHLKSSRWALRKADEHHPVPHHRKRKTGSRNLTPRHPTPHHLRNPATPNHSTVAHPMTSPRRHSRPLHHLRNTATPNQAPVSHPTTSLRRHPTPHHLHNPAAVTVRTFKPRVKRATTRSRKTKLVRTPKIVEKQIETQNDKDSLVVRGPRKKFRLGRQPRHRALWRKNLRHVTPVHRRYRRKPGVKRRNRTLAPWQKEWRERKMKSNRKKK